MEARNVTGPLAGATLVAWALSAQRVPAYQLPGPVEVGRRAIDFVTSPADLISSPVSGSLNENLGDLAPGGTITVTLSRTAIASDDCSGISNQASATITNESGPTPNSDTAFIDVLCTDITLTKTPDGAQIYPGETATFTITIHNVVPTRPRTSPSPIRCRMATGTW